MYSIFNKSFYIIALTGIIALSSASAQQIAQRGKQLVVLPLDTAVKTGVLPNGFTYFIRHNQTPEKRVVFYIVNKVGSVLETDSQQGLAHFLEHMNFNGTTHFPKNELINYLEKSGITFGADLNAYTNFDETVYQLPLPSDDPELLQNGLQIMRDWARGALLEPVEINKERGVILEEKRTRVGFGERFMIKSLPLVLNRSIYSRRLPIGTEKVLTTFKPDDIKRFYDTWYRPNLQALIVVGDIDVKQMEIAIKKMFSDLKNPKNELARKQMSILLTGKRQFLKFTDPEAQSSQIQLLYKFRSGKLRDAAEYRDNLVKNIYNQLLASRFNELKQRADLPYTQAGAGSENYMADLDVFNISVALKPKMAAAGFKNVYTEIERIRKYGFTAPELDRVKKSYLANMKALVKEKDKNSSSNYVGEYVNYFLKQEASPGIDAEYNMVVAYLPAITLTEVNKLTGKYLSTADQDLIVSGQSKEAGSLPDSAMLVSWMRDVTKSNITPYTDNSSDAVLMAVKPVPGKVVGKTTIKEISADLYTLSNGVKVMFRPSKFKNDEVYFSSFKAGGSSVSTDQDFMSAANAASLVSAGGLGTFNADQLNKLLTGKKLTVSPYINELYEGVNGGFGADDMETALQLIYMYHTNPRKDTVVFKNIISNVKIAINNRQNNPDAIFSDTLNAVLGNYNKRRLSPTINDINAIDLDKALAFYKKRFGNANGSVFVFTGNFDQERLLKLCEQYLGSLPTDMETAEGFKDLNINIPEGVSTHVVARGKEAKSEVKLVFSGSFSYGQKNNITLSALGSIIEFRLLERLRELEGGVYTPQAGSGYNKLPRETYNVNISFTCDPKNVDKLIAATLEEIDNLKNKGISAEDLEKFKAETLRNHEVRIKTDSYWLGYLVRQLSNNENITDNTRFVTDINSLNREDLQAAAKQYLGGKNLLKFILNSYGHKKFL